MFLDPVLATGRRVDFYVVDISGSIGADNIIVDPTCQSHIRKSEAVLFKEQSRIWQKPGRHYR